jgi:hypothetical protein
VNFLRGIDLDSVTFVLDELDAKAVLYAERAPFWAILDGTDLELEEDEAPASSMVDHVDGEDDDAHHRPYDYSDGAFDDDDEDDYDDPEDEDYNPYSGGGGGDVLGFIADEQIPEPRPPPVAPRTMTLREAFRYINSLP